MLFPLSGLRQFVKVFEANSRIGGRQDGHFSRNEILIGNLPKSKLGIGVEEGSGIASNGDTQDGNSKGTISAELQERSKIAQNVSPCGSDRIFGDGDDKKKSAALGCATPNSFLSV